MTVKELKAILNTLEDEYKLIPEDGLLNIHVDKYPLDIGYISFEDTGLVMRRTDGQYLRIKVNETTS